MDEFINEILHTADSAGYFVKERRSRDPIDMGTQYIDQYLVIGNNSDNHNGKKMVLIGSYTEEDPDTEDISLILEYNKDGVAGPSDKKIPIEDDHNIEDVMDMISKRLGDPSVVQKIKNL